VQSESSLRADTRNVNKIANSLIEKLGQCNERFAKLQEMTNKQVEKYTGLFPDYRNLKPREKGKKYQTECASKDVKTHAVEETKRN